MAYANGLPVALAALAMYVAEALLSGCGYYNKPIRRMQIVSECTLGGAGGTHLRLYRIHSHSTGEGRRSRRGEVLRSTQILGENPWVRKCK